MVAIRSNLFYTGRYHASSGILIKWTPPERKDRVLMIDRNYDFKHRLGAQEGDE